MLNMICRMITITSLRRNRSNNLTDFAACSAKIAGSFFLLALLTAGDVMAIEEPAYQVLVAEAPFEHRRYSGFVVAETILSGDFDSAS